MPVSPATQRESELTMRTAPVVVLTHAAIAVDAGAAMAAEPAISERPSAVTHLREDIETSWGRLLSAEIGESLR
jgi:hypothetical protein